MEISGINITGINISSLIDVPGAPTIGTATATGATTATVSFSAPVNNNGRPITSYTAVSSPGNITGSVSQSGSGTITVSGLTAGTSYTFTVYATNAIGDSPSSSPSNSITTIAVGQQLWDSSSATNGFNITSTTGNGYSVTSSFTVPAGVTSISIVTIGSGAGGLYRAAFVPPVGGAGGALAYRNNISVTPGETLTIAYGPGGGGTYVSDVNRRWASSSTVWRGTPFSPGSELLCGAKGGQSGWFSGSGSSVIPVYGDVGDAYIPGVGATPSTRGSSGSNSTSGWGLGGKGGAGRYGTTINGGAGGAGGYGGAGGLGADDYSATINATAGASGGGGGGGKTTTNLQAGQGGGTSVLGQGSNGAAGTNGTGTVGGAGGGGTAGTYTGQGRLYGGGGGSMSVTSWNTDNQVGQGGPGAVRIIWPGTDRQFPSTRTADE